MRDCSIRVGGMTPKAGMYANNSLLTFDLYNNAKIVGDLAERWDVAPDGKQLSFALRQGVKFHDRSDFTCANAYRLEKLADPKRAFPPLSSVMDNVFVSTSARPPWGCIFAIICVGRSCCSGTGRACIAHR
jgi:Bacterial extracellular solute-binding proteins, family 5 Middle